MVKVSAHRASALAISQASKELKKSVNNVWKLAPKAPMFLKKGKPTPEGKRNVTRTKRLIGNHAYKVLASGAAAHANAVMQREAKAFRLKVGGESKRTPWLPSISPGAICILENFLCAYAQSATRHAVSIRTGLKSHKRLNGRLLKIGYDTADAQIFQAAMPVPRNVLVFDPPAKKKKGSKVEEEKDYEPPDADNDGGDDDE